MRRCLQAIAILVIGPVLAALVLVMAILYVFAWVLAAALCLVFEGSFLP